MVTIWPHGLLQHQTLYSRTLLNWINWDGEPPRYEENTDNWIFLENRL